MSLTAVERAIIAEIAQYEDDPLVGVLVIESEYWDLVRWGLEQLLASVLDRGAYVWHTLPASPHVIYSGPRAVDAVTPH